MGGRGASSGMSRRGGKEYSYGTEFQTVLKDGNIKFVKVRAGSARTPMETMTKGRVYVTVNQNDNLKSITYYDTSGKRVKQIDLDHSHKGMQLHTHHGYEHKENDGPKGATNLTAEEKKMVERVRHLWYNRHGKQ